MIIVQPSVELVWITPEAARVIEFAARKCYKSEGMHDPAKTGAFLDKIVNQYHHESIVEHACACFDVVSDRGVSHEWVRHRIASYSQESTRYCNYGKDKHGNQIAVIQPPGIGFCEKCSITQTEHPACQAMRAWAISMLQAEKSYLEMLASGYSPQIARSVLPTCLKTEYRVTANFRSWLNFIKLRTVPAAHPQMREVALQVQAILQRECPEIFGQPQSS